MQKLRILFVDLFVFLFYYIRTSWTLHTFYIKQKPQIAFDAISKNIEVEVIL